MLCEKCHEREANVHLTQIIDDVMTKLDLCEVCSLEVGISPTGAVPPMTKLNMAGSAMVGLLASDSRYHVMAYDFVMKAVSIAAMSQAGTEGLASQHITGRQLLETFRETVKIHFGRQAKRILHGWGVYCCEDVGEIVFNLVEIGRLGKLPSDSKQDFQGGYNFDDAFPES